jgi:hypothetical protein
MLQKRELAGTPFTWQMAREDGMTRRRLERLLHDHEVRRVLQGVYVRADVPDTVELRVAAARLVLRPFVVVGGRTAAWLLGVDTFDYRELEILPPLETYALRGHNRTRRTGCTPRVRDLAPSDVNEVAGIQVTTPLRTTLDLACSLRRRDALAAIDGFRRAYGLTTDELVRELTRWSRRRGVVQARDLVPLGDPGAESPGESWVRMELIDRGLPCPQLQWWVEEQGRRLFRLDMAYPRHKVAVEYDGRAFHEDEERAEHDRLRRAWLRRNGWTVVVVTRHDFATEAVDRWVGEVREALRLVG